MLYPLTTALLLQGTQLHRERPYRTQCLPPAWLPLSFNPSLASCGAWPLETHDFYTKKTEGTSYEISIDSIDCGFGFNRSGGSRAAHCTADLAYTEAGIIALLFGTILMMAAFAREVFEVLRGKSLV